MAVAENLQQLATSLEITTCSAQWVKKIEENVEVKIQITERLRLRLIAPGAALCSLCLGLINLENLLFFPLALSSSRLSVFWPLLSFFSSPPAFSNVQVPMLSHLCRPPQGQSPPDILSHSSVHVIPKGIY